MKHRGGIQVQILRSTGSDGLFVLVTGVVEQVRLRRVVMGELEQQRVLKFHFVFLRHMIQHFVALLFLISSFVSVLYGHCQRDPPTFRSHLAATL